MFITCTLALATLTACGGGGDDVVANVDLNSHLPPQATDRVNSQPPTHAAPSKSYSRLAHSTAPLMPSPASKSPRPARKLQASARHIRQPFKVGDWQPKPGPGGQVDGTTIPCKPTNYQHTAMDLRALPS